MKTPLRRVLSPSVRWLFAALVAGLSTADPAQAADPGTAIPATSEASEDKPGSVLVYNLIDSDSANPNLEKTVLSITNTNSTTAVGVRFFFVSSAGAVTELRASLQQNQTRDFRAAQVAPNVAGYAVAIAVAEDGCPISFNHLTGVADLQLASGHAASLPAVAIAAQFAGTLPNCSSNSPEATLDFDGTEYNRLPATAALDQFGSRADFNSTLLVLNRLSGDLNGTLASLGSVFGLLYDDASNSLSFSTSANTQLRSILSNTFPRTTPRFETFIPSGRTGWMKSFQQMGNIGLLGVALNDNPNTATQASAFTGGHNLHHLNLNATDSLTLDVTPLFDGDGVDEMVEDGAPNDGDGNGDDIQDSVQDNIASLPSATGQGYLTISVSGGCSDLHDVAAVAEAALGDDENHSYPFGLLGFTLPCSSADIKIYYHGAESVPVEYRKYGPTPPSFNAPDFYSLPGVVFGTEMVAGQLVVTASFTLHDGQLGDSTGVDGTIVDPGGPASVIHEAPVLSTTATQLLLVGVLLIGAWLSPAMQSGRRHR